MKTMYLILVILAMAFTHQPAKTQYIHDNVKKIWETPDDLQVPESVYYDKSDKTIYVSNINGKPLDKDGNGFISVLDMEGNVKQLKWVTGMNAPKGMGVASGKLYVTDIDRLAVIDIADGEIETFYEAPKAKFLNDISIDDDGNVYVSDMNENKIYRLKDKEFKVWKELTGAFDRPNGLFAEKDYLLAGLKDRVIKIEYNTKDAETFIENTGSIDGLVPYGNGSYLISDWQGRTHLIAPGKEKIKLTDTTSEEVNAADIDYVIDKQMLLIPTFFANTVSAYKVMVE